MIDRRGLLQLGFGTALLAAIGRRAGAKRAGAKRAAEPKATSCILLYMEGGPSHIDTFDPKDGGEFKAIESAVKGVRISEHLPSLAARMKRLALIRSMTSREGNHARARALMHTGYAPQGGVDPPALGSLVAEHRGAGALPGYVSIGGAADDAGFLGAAWSPFPVRDPSKPVRYLARARGVDEERFDRRVALIDELSAEFDAGRASPATEGQRQVTRQAVAMMKAKELDAFSLDGEKPKTLEAYGDDPFGRGCLMARKLVEAGVPFVEVTQRGWDTHRDNFAAVKTLSGPLDRAMSALLDDLEARGLLSSTLVVWMGDFGRTPRVNANGGRDHHPRCFTVALAGGGVKGGRVIGASDAEGAEPVDRPVTVPDLFRTLASALGLDPDRSRIAPSGRPLKTVDGGTVVEELFG